MHKLKSIFLVSLALLTVFIGCASRDVSSQTDQLEPSEVKTRRAKFSGNYNREFNDLNSIHVISA
ncbi:MAG: hypothetical protein GX857_09715, partial [Bacteroidales bacterium]|nr:hypothetical protein [Bacteroidales bacterium]